ncbi:MAG: lycopene cyclase domain-containing protein [Rhodoluna sp.]
MNYVTLNLIFLAIAVGALLLVPKNRWPAYLVGLLPMLLLTLIFDNLIVGTGIVDYDATKISGLMLGSVPIEDFAYTIAAVLIVPSVWSAMTRRKRK